jgi:acyl-CoA thioester hydrolase
MDAALVDAATVRCRLRRPTDPDYAPGMTGPAREIDPWRFTMRYPVRQYELDALGHVNNAVYLNWVEQVAIDHVEALGFGRAWSLARGGTWVVRQHRVTYHLPLLYGDVVLVTTMPQWIGGARGLRRTEMHRASDGALTTEAETEWIWVRSSDGRPARVPADLVAAFPERDPA